MKKVKEVSSIDQFIAVMDFLEAMGYDTTELSLKQAIGLKFDIVEAISPKAISPNSSTFFDPDDQVTVY